MKRFIMLGFFIVLVTASLLCPNQLAVGQEPVHGGDLRVGIMGYPEVWDSAFATGPALRLTKLVLDPLVFIGEDLSPNPGLAKNWETIDGGSTWDFELVETSWHDGTPFTARDVKAHFERILNPETGSPARAVFDIIHNIEVLETNKVRFELKLDDMEFPVLLGQYQGPIQPADFDPDIPDFIGTGPFMVNEVVPGESVHFVRNTNYFMDDLPYLDSIQLVNFDDESARIRALADGIIDVAPGIPGVLVAEVERYEHLHLSQSIPATTLTVYLRADQSPGNNQKVVQALKNSIDREGLVQAALRGYGVPAGDNPIPPDAPFHYDTGVPERDIEKAKSLLEEAGYPDGVDLELYVPVGAVGSPEQLALGIQSMARSAGFNIQLIMLPSDILYAEYWLNVNFGITSWAPRPTFDAQFRVAYTSDAAWNESHWRNAHFDEMLDRARGLEDAYQRENLQKEIQEYFVNHGNTIIPYFFPLIAASRAEIKELVEHPMLYYTDFRRVWMNK